MFQNLLVKTNYVEGTNYAKARETEVAIIVN